MLAKAPFNLPQLLIRLFIEHRSLRHQLLPAAFRLSGRDREVKIVHNHLCHFRWKAARLRYRRLGRPPVSLLRRDVGRGNNGHGWVDEEQRKNLAMTRLRRISQLEGLYLVLVHVGKEQRSLGSGPHLLNCAAGHVNDCQPHYWLKRLSVQCRPTQRARPGSVRGVLYQPVAALLVNERSKTQ